MREKQQATLRAHLLRAKPAASREDLERARELRHARVAPLEWQESAQVSQLTPEGLRVRVVM
jgi:hypothetical protein